ncbi:MAG: hypothetical protein K8T89_06790 [Planctomycetes bacterium]|nr:hypothetical protein [Planctomycetota bacterium]
MNRHIYLFLSTLLTISLFGTAIAEPPKQVPPLPEGPSEIPASRTKSASPARLDDTTKPYDVIVVMAAADAKANTAEVGVGFFNHSERDVVIDLNGRTIKLGSRHYLSLKLPREFTWREKDGPSWTTKIPDKSDGIEIVFRR